MSVEDLETVLKHIDGLISPQEIQGGHRLVLSEERLVNLFSLYPFDFAFQVLTFEMTS